MTIASNPAVRGDALAGVLIAEAATAAAASLVEINLAGRDDADLARVATHAGVRRRPARTRWPRCPGASALSALTVHRAHGVGAEPRGAGPRLPQHGVRECAGPAVRDGRRARLGQLAVVRLLRVGLGHRALDPPRERGHLDGPSAVGERGSDDVLLPGRRARGEARVRPGGAAGTAPHRPPRDGGARRHDGAGADLPGVQRRRRRGGWLGSGDVDRHGVRARRACAGGPAARRACAFAC